MIDFFGPPKPVSVMFFPNGNAAVCDQFGKQMPKYQQGKHADTIAALEADGINWHEIPEVFGCPMREHRR